MVEGTIVVILMAMLWLGCLAQGSQDQNDQWSRVSWIGIGCGLIVAIHAPNPWSAVLIAGISLGMLWHPPMSVLYRDKLAQGLVLAGAYVLAAPLMREWMVVPMLALMGLIGAVVGCRAIYGSCQPVDRGFRHEYLRGWLIFVDRDGGAPLAEQGNFNHAQAVGALSAAASMGLVWLQHWWGLPLLMLSVVAVALCTEGRMTGKWMSQGWVHLFWLGWTSLGLFIASETGRGWWAWCLWTLTAAALFMYAHPWSPRANWHDSGRFAIWNLALRDIWWTANQPKDPLRMLAHLKAERALMEERQAQAAKEGDALVHNQLTVAKQQNEEQQRRVVVLAKQRAHEPLTVEEWSRAQRLWAQRVRVRLLGCGTGSWYPLTKWPSMVQTGTINEEKAKWEGCIYLSAHNEFVEVLFEQGLLGFAAACGMAYDAISSTWNTPVFLPVMVLLSVCLTNFPFTLFAEVERATPDQSPQFVGSPALLVMSLMILLMVEAVW